MNPPRPITIVGGGLAGLALGIALRHRGVPVILFEAGSYPRHRVCGEFLSGGGLSVLRELGLFPRLLEAGAMEAHQAGFASGTRLFRSQPLPSPAWCLSRHSMDRLLAEEFRRLGGDLRERQRCSPGTYGPGMVRAAGRRLDASRARPFWIGLKAHARGVTLAADLEMHFLSGGYVGMCRLNDGWVNVCGLFRVDGPVPKLAERWMDYLRGTEGTVLHGRLRDADFESDTFCAVSGLNLRPVRARDQGECCVGDALTMIPPVTGNGMSMALESAAWAADPLTAYSRGELAWDVARGEVARRCDQGFRTRLRWARGLQWALFQPVLRDRLLRASDLFPGLWRAWYCRTR
jgi:2-polyprenyl-6-methoxyphenol hydroxylase-like FAD-dependent oxidoreductase